jgi:hypothetical protein
MKSRLFVGKITEGKLAWWNEVSAGIGLVVGYLLFGLYWLFTPDTVVEVETQVAQYEKTIVGYIPEDIDNLDGRDIFELVRSKPVMINTPMYDSKGRPVITTKHKTYIGKGKPKIVVTNIEILRPKIASPEIISLQTSGSGSTNPVRFRLNIINEGTGLYVPEKTVVFDGVASGDIFALRVATLFAFLALLLFLIRVRKKVSNYLKNLTYVNHPLDDDDAQI